jgi:hypothetical protein
MPDVHSADRVLCFRHNTILPEHPCSGEVIEHQEFSTSQSRVGILLSVWNGVSIRAGFRLADGDYARNAKPDLAI